MTVSRLVVVFLLLMATHVQAQLIGCFNDTSTRDLNGFETSSPNNTNAVCRQTCAAKGFDYSGTQYGAYCFCGNTYGKYGPATNCDSPCTGNPSGEMCGGSFANSVSRTGRGTLSPPSAPIILEPKDTSRSNWQPATAIVGTGIPLTWQVTGTPNDAYRVTHWLELWRWNRATRAWEPVYQNYVGGPVPMNFKFIHPVQVARGTCYYWLVYGVNPQRNTNPWYTPSGWSGFCTTN